MKQQRLFMTKNLYDSFNKISPIVIEILAHISVTAKKYKVPFFIVGATARDIFFKSSRATIDLDLGIQVAAWESYKELLNALAETKLFRISDSPHRLYYFKDDYPLDIVPFGSISEGDGTITWPDKNKMTILGFEEAYKNCYEFKVKEIQNGSIRVASPVGLVAMKIISWADSIDRAQKDAEDLNLIFSEYYDVLGNSERIYEYPKILEATNFDIVLSGIVLLGKDTADILNEDTLNAVRTIIDFEIDIKNNCRLASDMSKTNMFSENLEKKLQMLIFFRVGLYLR